MAKDESLFDMRVVERNIRKGLITRKDYEKYLESLEDKEDEGEPIESEFEVGVLDDDDDEAADDDDDEDEDD